MNSQFTGNSTIPINASCRKKEKCHRSVQELMVHSSWICPRHLIVFCAIYFIAKLHSYGMDEDALTFMSS